MILTRRKSVWTRQPPDGVQINDSAVRRYGLCGGFIAPQLTHFNGSPLGYVNLAYLSLEPSSIGLAAVLRETTEGVGRLVIVNSGSPNTRSFTFMARVLLTAAPSSPGVIARSGSNGSGNDIFLWRNGTAFDMRVGGTDFNAAGTWALNTWYDIEIVGGATATALFVNGVQTIVTGAAASATIDVMAIGDCVGGGVGSGDIHIGHILFANKPLGATERRELRSNIYNLYSPRTRTTIISLGAGSSSSTLNASASGAAQSGGSASLAAQVALAGVGVAVAGGSALAGVSVPLSAAGIAIAGGSADATATVRISAAGLAQAAGSAGLSASILLAAAGTAQAAGNATLAAQLAALASGSAQAGGAAVLSGGAPGALAASGGAQSGGQAVLSVTVRLAATGAAQAGGSATGSASAPGQIAASGSAQSGGSATVSVTVQITAAGFVQAMGAGELTVHIPISASGGAIAAGLANLTAGGVVRSVAPCRQIQVAAERRAIAVPAERRRLAVSAENRRVRVL